MNNMSITEKIELAGKIIEFMKSLDGDFISTVHSELSARLVNDAIVKFIEHKLPANAINGVVESIDNGEVAGFINGLSSDFDRLNTQSVFDVAPSSWRDKALSIIPVFLFIHEMNKLVSVVTDRQDANVIINLAKTILAEMIERGDNVEMARQYMDLPPLIFGNHNHLNDGLTDEMKRDLISQAMFETHCLVLSEIVNRLLDRVDDSVEQSEPVKASAVKNSDAKTFTVLACVVNATAVLH